MSNLISKIFFIGFLIFSFSIVTNPIQAVEQNASQDFLLDYIKNPPPATDTQTNTKARADVEEFIKNIQGQPSYKYLSEEDEFYMTLKDGQSVENFLKGIQAENARRTALGQTNLLPDPTVSTNPANTGTTQQTPLSGQAPPIPNSTNNTQTPMTTTNLSIFDSIAPASTFNGQPLSNLLNQIFYIGLGIAVILAIVMIVRGGIQYMTIDAASSKDSGKKMVQAALGGLVLAFAAILILNTINPKLTELNLSFTPLKSITGLPQSLTSGTRVDPTTGQVSNTGLAAWGDATAATMQGKTIDGRQTYYASGEAVSDSDTDAGLGAYGKLVEGTSSTVGSAASVYYPAGTLIKSNGITYVIDDNNLKRQSDGSLKPANQNLTNNYTIDIYTSNINQANNVSTNNSIEVLYVPKAKVGASGVSDIRNNPSNYIGK